MKLCLCRAFKMLSLVMLALGRISECGGMGLCRVNMIEPGETLGGQSALGGGPSSRRRFFEFTRLGRPAYPIERGQDTHCRGDKRPSPCPGQPAR